eukprot:403356896
MTLVSIRQMKMQLQTSNKENLNFKINLKINYDYENQLHYKTFLDKKVNIYVFEDMYSASKYISDKKQQTFILITSGTNGENFVNYVHDYKNVKSIVVFCLNVMYHETWAKKYMKVAKVTRDPEFLMRKGRFILQM